MAPFAAPDMARIPDARATDILVAHDFGFASSATPFFETEADGTSDITAIYDPAAPPRDARHATGDRYFVGGYAFFGANGDALGQLASLPFRASSTEVTPSPLISFKPGVGVTSQFSQTTAPLVIAASEIVSQGTEIGSSGEGQLQELIQDENDGNEKADIAGGGLRLNAGYSSIEGISVGGKITRTNIFGLNTELGASARYSKVRTSFEIGYSDGKLLGSNYAFATTLFADRIAARSLVKDLRLSPFRQSTRGINIMLNGKFKDGLSATVNYRWSDDSFDMIGKGALCDSAIFGSAICNAIGKTKGSLLSIALTFEEKSRHEGKARHFKLQLIHDLSVGGSVSFSRTRVGSKAQVDLGGGWNFSFDAEGGYMVPLGDKQIPLFDRFFISDSGMRGFDSRGVGPKIRPTGAKADEHVGIGGRAYYLTRTELTVAIGGVFGANGIRPGVFVDAGSVFEAGKAGLLPGEILVGNMAKPRVSVGIGLAISTPVGKLRIDFAKPVYKQEGDRAKMLSISFGAAI